jgi:hypothetical protein
MKEQAIGRPDGHVVTNIIVFYVAPGIGCQTLGCTTQMQIDLLQELGMAFVQDS